MAELLRGLHALFRVSTVLASSKSESQWSAQACICLFSWVGIVATVMLPTVFSVHTVFAQPEPRAITITELSLSSSNVRAGDPVRVTFKVTNTGFTTRPYQIPVLVDDVPTSIVSGQLPPGGIRVHATEVSGFGPERYHVTVGELVQTFTVDPESFVVSQFRIFPRVVEPGDTVKVTATVRNDGGSPGWYHARVKMDGVRSGASSTFLPAGNTAALMFSIETVQSGTHVISLGDQAVSILVLQPTLTVDLVENIPLSKDGISAFNQWGEAVPMMNELIHIRPGATEGFLVELPFRLRSGERLVAFRDLATGAEFRDGLLSLPIPVKGLPSSVRLVADIDPPTGPGISVVSLVSSLQLHVKDLSVDLTVADEQTGRIDLDLMLGLPKAALGSQVELRLRRDVTEEVRLRLNQSLRMKQIQALEGVFGLDIVDSVTEKPIEIHASEFSFSLTRGWTDRDSSRSSLWIGQLNAFGTFVAQFEKVQTEDSMRSGFQITLPPGKASLRMFSAWRRPAPERIALTDVRVASPVSSLGDVVEVKGTLTNPHPQGHLLPVTLFVNGEASETRMVFLEAGEEKTVSFKLRAQKLGDLVIGLNDQTATIKVLHQLPLGSARSYNLSVFPSRITVGDSAEISFEIENLTPQAGLVQRLLRSNGIVVQQMPVILNAGEAGRVVFEVTPRQMGVYQFNIGGLSTNLKVDPVSTAAEFVAGRMSIDSSVVDPGQQVTISFVVTNNGDLAGNFVTELRYRDEMHLVGPLWVPERTTLPFETTVTLKAPGTYEIQLASEKVHVRVRDAASMTFRTTNLRLTPREVLGGEPITVEARVTNVGDTRGKDEVVLQLNRMIKHTQWLWLQPGASTEFSFTIEEESPGEHIVHVNGLQGSFVVNDARSPWTNVVIVAAGLLVMIAGVVAIWIARARKRRNQTLLDTPN